MSTDAEHDDLEQNEPVIVDCDVLEAAKENIQPLAKGRRVTTLAGILATPHIQRESRLAATRNRLRMNVQLALENSTPDEDEDGEVDDIEGADPLDAYCQYVYWVVENYPQGHSAESGLLELLEEATRVLKDHQGGKWRGDLRYLKLWVLYASYVEKPAIIFKFCMVNEIGTSHSLLYEEFAIALERANRKAQADETYQVGIARKAHPLERLESKYREFQKRMMSSPTLPSQTESEEAGSSAAPVAQGAPKRKALTEAKSASRTTTRTTRSSSRAAASPAPTTTPTLPQTTRPQPNARLQVYVDPSPEAASAAAAIEEEAPSAWPELGTRKSRVKENIKEATKAAGTTLPQAGRAQRAAVSRRTPKIDVYRDPGPEEADENGAPAEVTADPEPETSPPPPPRTAPRAKTGKAIEVFLEDTPDDASAVAPPSKSKTSKKSAIPVFRDDAASSSSSRTTAAPAKASKSRTASKSSIPVFRDEDALLDPAPAPARSLKGKSKSVIPVFRDEPDDDAENQAAPAPAPQTGSLKGKSRVAVFRDDDSSRASAPAKKTVKSKIAVFRDDEAKEPSGSEVKKKKTKIAVFRDEDALDAETKAKGKIPMPVFRDPEPAPSKSKIAIFRDEDGAEPPATEKKGKGKIAIFRDEDAQEDRGTGKPKSKIAVFCDADLEPDAPAPSKVKGKIAVFRDEDGAEPSDPTSKGKGKFPIFRDEDAQEPTSPRTKSRIAVFRDEAPAAATPAFTPHRDEDVPQSPTKLGRSRSGTGVGLGIAGLGAGSSRMSSEAEALRRDPLKNYAEGERVDLD